VTDTLLLVDGPKPDALAASRLFGIFATFHRSLPTQNQTILRADIDQYQDIYRWWLQGTTLRRTFGEKFQDV
jgi:hypothetical protein